MAETRLNAPGRVILVCGKICSGKTRHACALKDELNAVLLSVDELTWELIDNQQGELYDRIAPRASAYLQKKAAQIALSGANVILDWGFWTQEKRREATEFFTEQGIKPEWRYMDISDETWRKNIMSRNERVSSGQGGSDFYVTEGLINKLLSRFEAPRRNEIDVWVEVR